jgi:chromosome segregation protein
LRFLFLRRLEFVGFKSFATRTTTDLPPGIVVVVGPNGSGKSNIADAVRWVLGEQSAKAVRARKPEEVIFAGSAARQPLGMAEVSLVLDNSDGAIPLDFAEVRISRRLYRSGESEYLLNAGRARLRDLTNYLLHARLGPDSYCVIGQGSVDELILQRPEERRVAFENAADIRRYQLKLVETRNKLAATQSNLVRVQDVLAELAPHVRRLKGQADRAARADSLRAELQRLSVRYYRDRLRHARAEMAAAERALAEASTGVQDAEARSAEAHLAWSSDEQALADADRRLAALRPQVDGYRDQARVAERGLAVTRERLAAVTEQRSSMAAELERLAQRLDTLRRDEAGHAARLQQVHHAPADAVQEMASLRERLGGLGPEVARAQQGTERARQARDAADRRILAAEGEQARGEQRLRQLEATLAVDEALRADRQARMEQLADTVGTLTGDLVTAQERLNTARRALAEVDEAHRSAGERAARAREAARASAQQADRLQGALEALGAGERRQSGALAAAWRDALDGLPVVGLAGDLAARVRPIDRLRRGYLMRTVVLSDDPAARAAHARLTDAFGREAPAWAVLSLDGLLLCAEGERSIEADLGEGSALADWRRKVREFEAERTTAQSARRQAEAELAEATQALAEAHDAVSTARATVQELELALHQASRAEAAAKTELAELQADMARAQTQRESVAAERRAYAARAEAAHSELKQARTMREEAAEALIAAEARLGALRDEVATTRTRLAALEGAEAKRVADRSSIIALLERIRADRVAAETATHATEERLAQLGQQAAELADRESRLTREAEASAAELAPLEASLATAEQERVELLQRRRAAEQRMAGLRAAERAAHEQREAALVRAQRARDELERLQWEVAESAEAEEDEEGVSWTRQLRLELSSDELKPTEDEPLADPDAARKRITLLQRDLRALGGVSATVVDEYRELSERHDFLLGQSQDLQAAMAELREAAEELEAHMRTRFAEIFEAVNTAFQECFATLFGGGEARLVLTQPEDLLQTGVEIVARPPGKKLQGLLSLSGGERALTIVALLFGLLKVNPTPFCVLDEVDAALDEANVQRFAKLLADFSRQIQFIVVSHNRATMEMADAMLGVTMDTNGVSRVLSVQPRAVVTRS